MCTEFQIEPNGLSVNNKKMWDLTENGLISPADQETEGEVILHPAPLVEGGVERGQTLLRVHLSPGPGLGRGAEN